MTARRLTRSVAAPEITGGVRGFVPAGYTAHRLPGGGTVLVHRRSRGVSAGVLLVALSLAVAGILTGTYAITSGDAIRILLTGVGSDLDRFIVLDQRLPRALAALLVGAALGTSGAIFQSTSRNPLASPDIIGFTTGAATGGLATILILGSATGDSIMVGTIAGGCVTAVAVILFTLRNGLTGDRLIVSGIALAAMLAAVNDYLLSRAPIQEAETARTWQHGSLNAISWPPLLPLGITLVAVIPAMVLTSRSMRALEIGDEAAAGTGVHPIRVRLVAFVIGIGLTGMAVATAGPIGFLALAAPQLARRMCQSPGIAMMPSMAMGALILTAADLIAQRLLSPFQIPVGLVTAALGGAYLIWLLTWARDSSDGHPAS